MGNGNVEEENRDGNIKEKTSGYNLYNIDIDTYKNIQNCSR